MHKVTLTVPLYIKSYTCSLKYLENGESKGKRNHPLSHYSDLVSGYLSSHLCIFYLTRVGVHSFEPYFFGPLNIIC